jgi:hypothetical protein
MPKKPKRTPRAVRTDYWRRPIADPTEAAAELEEARGRLVLAGVGGRGDEDVMAKLKADVATAQAKVDQCFEKIRLHALTGAQFEELLGEHPPTEADEAKDLAHHDATFLPALLTACCDNGWGLDDWNDELVELSVGERNELRQIVTHLNTRSWSSQIPKG